MGESIRKALPGVIMSERLRGPVTHYFGGLDVAVQHVNEEWLDVGGEVQVRGYTADSYVAVYHKLQAPVVNT